jgi:hypothetical protein
MRTSTTGWLPRLAVEKGFSKHRNPRPLYDGADAANAISQLTSLPYHTPAPRSSSWPWAR